MSARNERNIAILDELANLAARQRRDSPSLGQGLSDVVTHSAKLVPGVQYAGITLVSRSGGITTPASSHRYPVMLDGFQARHKEGPCISAAWEHHTMRIDDISFERRWPKYREDVLTKTPIRAVLSFELSTDYDALSALNFYADRAHAFDEESVELGMVVATHAAMSWTLLSRGEQFRSALASRDVIGQAKGIIMERFNIDAMEAFTLLAKLSQQSNRKLVDVAELLVAKQHPSVPDRP